MLDNMLERIYSVVSEDEDSVRLYILCGHCIGSVVIVGKGEVSRDRDVYILLKILGIFFSRIFVRSATV